MWTTPNILTLARLVLLIPICLCLGGGWNLHALAFALYVMAAATDYADGWWARTYNESSDFGRMLDPVVDKIFIAALFIVMSATGMITGLMLACPIVILAREFLVAGLREYLGPRGITLPVTQLAKWKTTVQMVAIGLLIFPGLGGLGTLLLVVATILTLYTGWAYVRTALRATGA